MLIRTNMGSDGIAYIRSCLAQGHELAAKLLELPLEKGEIITYLPEDVDVEEAKLFQQGGLVKRSQTEPIVVALIQSYLGRTGKPHAVFEDAVAQLGDPFLVGVDNLLFHGRTIYYFLNAKDKDQLRIADTLRGATSYQFIGSLTDLSAYQDLVPGEVASSSLEAIAQNTCHILVGAYDGDGYVIWSRV